MKQPVSLKQALCKELDRYVYLIAGERKYTSLRGSAGERKNVQFKQLKKVFKIVQDIPEHILYNPERISSQKVFVEKTKRGKANGM
tara:strand:+ start:1919 stop:2176 length:258 start_codon:yes stop_codon:yes gene_type:complete